MGDRVLSISKLEPLEYFILKEIRSSLKAFLKQTNDKQYRETEAIASSLKQKFIREVRRVSSQFVSQLSNSVDYYFELLILAINKL